MWTQSAIHQHIVQDDSEFYLVKTEYLRSTKHVRMQSQRLIRQRSLQRPQCFAIETVTGSLTLRFRSQRLIHFGQQTIGGSRKTLVGTISTGHILKVRPLLLAKQTCEARGVCRQDSYGALAHIEVG